MDVEPGATIWPALDAAKSIRAKDRKPASPRNGRASSDSNTIRMPGARNTGPTGRLARALKAEMLARLYNIGLFHRTIANSPDWYNVAVDIDDVPTIMTLTELEKILAANKDRLRIILANEKPIKVARV